MSEQYHPSAEFTPQPETPEKPRQPENEPNQPEAAQETQNIEQLKQTAEQLAVSHHETTADADNNTSTPHTAFANRELKQMALHRSLVRIRKQLHAPERTLSKIIHAPGIDTASDIAGKTIGRPSGLLGGGLCAFLGSATVLYLAKTYGFTYNFSVFLILFVCGFAVGSLLELAIRSLRSIRKS